MELFPPIPYQGWSETIPTLHRFAQIVGKVRLAASARRNHWWNVPFHLTGRGITTRPMGLAPTFSIDFDFVAHKLAVSSIEGRSVSFPISGHSVASFHAELAHALAVIGVDSIDITNAHPFDLPDAGRPFAKDTEHATYDPAAVTRYWQVLSQVNLVLEEFAARYSAKTSPVHHFWHTFDIALTRFADTAVAQPPSNDPVTREAYSREVVSFGFWFGDLTFPDPAFYSYTAPEPAGVADEPLPVDARWVERGNGHLAVLTYHDVRGKPDRKAAVLDFYESAYRAGAFRAGWDLDRYACINGITDPQRRRPTNLAHRPSQAAAGGILNSSRKLDVTPTTEHTTKDDVMNAGEVGSVKDQTPQTYRIHLRSDEFQFENEIHATQVDREDGWTVFWAGNDVFLRIRDEHIVSLEHLD